MRIPQRPKYASRVAGTTPKRILGCWAILGCWQPSVRADPAAGGPFEAGRPDQSGAAAVSPARPGPSRRPPRRTRARGARPLRRDVSPDGSRVAVVSSGNNILTLANGAWHEIPVDARWGTEYIAWRSEERRVG